MAAGPFDETYLKSAAALAELEIPEARNEQLLETGAPIHEMFRAMTDVDLGETPPSTAYFAGWE